MKKIKQFATPIALAVVISTSCTGCGFIRPYDKPELVTIEASQTAFLIPLNGNTEDQASFESEELLAAAKVATKEVQIPHRWLQTGRMSGTGKWIPSAKLIVVERTPETREWNSSATEGTSTKNQAISAESKESIGFSVGMNCSCQIYTEDDAVKFLYSYNNKTLEQIMDTEIRARVESDFVEQCATYTLNEILERKEEIMTAVRDDVTSYFGEKGITITVLGMKDGIKYNDENIQAAINEKFSSEQKLITQQNDNAVTLSKAEADAEANRKLSESLTPELIEKMNIENFYSKWNGELPKVSSGSDSIMDIGNVLDSAKTEQ